VNLGICPKCTRLVDGYCHYCGMVAPTPPSGMIAIPAGRFLLEARSDPAVLAWPCYMDRHPVTVAQFGEFLNTLSPSQLRELKIKELGGFAATEASFPATGITWRAAAAYAQWRGKRLPTELEWAIAAGWDPVAGVMRVFPWGSEFDAQHPRCNVSGRLCSVGDFDAEGVSPLGCCDMVGNASEWCAEDSQPIGDGKTTARTNDGKRSIRGGSCVAGPAECRVAWRAGNHAEDASPLIGFRCVLAVNLEKRQ
jgi:formylglycine-generating enzyme required for sulfatase activity